MIELKIDKEFSEVLPTSEQRYKDLEAEVLKDGCFTDPFITWNGYIIDGHTRYKVMQAHPELDLQPYEKKMDGKFNEQNLIRRLSKHAPIEIIRNGRASLCKGDAKWAREILAIYNNGTSTSRLPDLFA